MASTSTATATATAGEELKARWARLTLLLEPHLTDVSGNDASKLLDITPDGEAVYEPKEDAAARLTKDLRTLWSRGDYADITEESLRREEEAERAKQVAGADGMDVDAEGPDDEDEDEDSEDEGMRPEELWKMKQEVLMKLHEARQQMLASQTLIALLQQSSGAPAPKPPPPRGAPSTSTPSLPPPSHPPLDGLPSITATLTTPLPPPPSSLTRKLQLSTGLKNTSLRHAARVFERAAGDIERGLEKEGQYFERALGLREMWRLAPRVERGVRRTRAGQREGARDFEVHYGMEGAPLHQRAAAVAHLSPLHVKSTLLFPSRTHRRLRITLLPLAPSSLSYLAGSSLLEPTGAATAGEEDLNAQLQEAQREVLDREIFERVGREAMELVQLAPVIRERMVSLRPLPDLQLTFELVDSDSSSLDDGSEPTKKVSPEMTLLAALLPILHLPRTRPALLKPLLQVLQYLEFCTMLSTKIDALARGLNASGVQLDVQKTFVSAEGDSVWKALLGSDAWAIGGEVRLQLAHCAPVFLSLSYPSNCLLQTPRMAIPITSQRELADALASELLARLAGWFQRIANTVLASRAAGMAQEAEWVLSTGAGGKGWGEWRSGAVGFQLAIDSDADYRVRAQAVFSKRAIVGGREGMSPATPGMGRLESVTREWPDGKMEEEEDMDGSGNGNGGRSVGLGEWFERGMRWVLEEE